MSEITTEVVTEKQNTVGSGVLMLLTLDNPVFSCYLFWMSILVLKMMFMSILTAVQRFRSKTYSSPEDIGLAKVAEVKFGNDSVERVRRCHRNDLETVLPYLIVALLYVTTDPKATVARYLFRIASISRLLHTAVYAFRPVPQPARGLTWGVTFAITIFMAVCVAIHTIQFI